MNRYARCLALFAILMGFLSGIRQVACASEPSSDLAKTALRKQEFPWYDAQKDQFRPMAPIKQAEPEPEKPVKELQSSTSAGSASGSLSTILMWFVLIALIAVVATIALRTMQDALQDSSGSRASATVALETLEALPEPVRNVRDLLGEATRLTSMSDFDSAMLFYYSWQLLQLDRHQQIELQKGKTNRQYLREVAASAPELLDLFSPSMRLFEDTFFGQLPVTREEFLQVWEQRHRLELMPRSQRS